MKKIVLLVLAGTAIAFGCYAKCINSTHNTEKNSSKDYVCAIKKDEQTNFKEVQVDANTSLHLCKNCGCPKETHDAN